MFTALMREAFLAAQALDTALKAGVAHTSSFF